jgi:hypothetical protein
MPCVGSLGNVESSGRVRGGFMSAIKIPGNILFIELKCDGEENVSSSRDRSTPGSTDDDIRIIRE